MDFSNISLLIIAGGKSSRMKKDKRTIELDGVSLIERILIKASKQNFADIFLCVETSLPFIEELAMKYQTKIILDDIQGLGPMSGLAEGLANVKTDWALAISCDMPFFDFNTVSPLLNNLDDSKVVMFNHQPLAAFYHKSLYKIFQNSLDSNKRKLRVVIESVQSKIISNSKFNIPNSAFFNVNTLGDLRLAKGRLANLKRQVPIISIVAPASGTGKTTFIEKLILRLKDLGIKTGVIKSDSHVFDLDVEGKDSYKFQQAGAESVAIVSSSGYFIIQKTEERADFLKIADKLENVDLILTESRTHDTIPAILLYRGIGEPFINDNIVAVFTKNKIEAFDDVLQFDLDDIEQVVSICLFLMGRSA